MAYLIKLKKGYIVLANDVFINTVSKRKPITYYYYKSHGISGPIPYDDVLDWIYLGDINMFITEHADKIWSYVKNDKEK